MSPPSFLFAGVLRAAIMGEDRFSNMIVWYREDLRALPTAIGAVSTDEPVTVLEKHDPSI